MFKFRHYYIFNVRNEMYTNINIVGKGEIFCHIAEYIPSEFNYANEYAYLHPEIMNIDNGSNIDDIVFIKSSKNYIKHHNRWVYITDNGLTQYIPSTYRKATIRLYFPQHTLESYGYNGSYGLIISTWIAGKQVVLSSSIINIMDKLACPPTVFSNQQFIEYMDCEVIDPFSLLFDDDWEDFRVNVCNERNFEDEYNLNNTGSLIYVSLHPIDYVDGQYIKNNDYVGGQGNILYNAQNNDLQLTIKHNCGEPLSKNEDPAILCSLKFNNVYEGNLFEYLKETYLIDNYNLRYELVIGNDTDIYAVLNSNDTLSTNYKFTKTNILESGNFRNWTGWKEGIYITASVEIIDMNGGIISLVSNKIPFNRDIYRFFVDHSDFNSIKNINLNNINMKLHNIQAVNKIENVIIQSEAYSDSKSHIVQPIFYRSIEASNIAVHMDVTETICLNLDQYKSKVKSFVLQLEGILFNEIGRVPSGVLFKVIGQKLPKKQTNGQYYILDQDLEMVTFGKYNYL